VLKHISTATKQRPNQKRNKSKMKKITDSSVTDQHEAARAHAQMQEAATNSVMRHQTRRMSGSESTQGEALLVGGKLAALAKVAK
jgi:hypothetical protein